jgi:hypothetical protein
MLNTRFLTPEMAGPGSANDINKKARLQGPGQRLFAFTKLLCGRFAFGLVLNFVLFGFVNITTVLRTCLLIILVFHNDLI